MTSDQYLDAVKARLSLPSDYALAKALGVKPSGLGNYRSGRSFPDTFMCFKIAHHLGLDPARVVADIEAESAEAHGKPERAWAWRELASKLGQAAASVVAAVILSAPPAPASASTGAPSQAAGADSTRYISSRKRRRESSRSAARQALATVAETLTGRRIQPA